MRISPIVKGTVCLVSAVFLWTLYGCGDDSATRPSDPDNNTGDSTLAGIQFSPSTSDDGQYVYFAISGDDADSVPHGDLYRLTTGSYAMPQKLISDLGLRHISVAPSGQFLIYEARDSVANSFSLTRVYSQQTGLDPNVYYTFQVSRPVVINDSIIVRILTEPSFSLSTFNLHTGQGMYLRELFCYQPSRVDDDEVMYTGGSFVHVQNIFTGAITSTDTLSGVPSPRYVLRSRDGSILVCSEQQRLYRFHPDTKATDTLTNTALYGPKSMLLLPHVCELPDGRIVYTGLDSSLWITGADGTQCKRWTNLKNKVTY